MEIQLDQRSNVEVVHIVGRVDSGNANELEKTFSDLFNNRRHKIVVDLAGVTYISSMGIRALISAKKATRGRFGNVHLANPSEQAREVIDIAGLEHVFTIYDTVDEAVDNY